MKKLSAIVAVFLLVNCLGIFQEEAQAAAYASVQHITVTIAGGATSGTTTITSVDTSLTALIVNGWINSTSSDANGKVQGYVQLTDATTVTATRGASSANATVVYVDVVTFDTSMIQSIQYVSGAMASGDTTKAITISAVTVNNTVVHYLGSDGTGSKGTAQLAGELTTTTNINCFRVSTGAATTGYFVVIEFKSAVLNSAVRLIKKNSSSSSTTAVSPTVTTANCITFYGGVSANAQDYNNVEGYLSSSSVFTTEMSPVGNDGATYVGYIAEFVAGYVTSYHGDVQFDGSSATSKDTTITAVTLASAMVSQGGLKSYNGAGTTWPSYYSSWAWTLTSTTNLRLLRVATVSGANYFGCGYNVVDFAQMASASKSYILADG